MRGRELHGTWLVALLLAPCALSQGAMADAAIKARVALAVARFAEMSAEKPAGPLRLCVAVQGKPPQALLDLGGEKIGTRGVNVQAGPPFSACDVIYVHSSFREWRRLVAEQRGPTLTIGDVSGFLAAGGMIELVIDNDSVRFDVNLAALRGQRIRLPAQVLKLARQVRE